MIEVNNIEGFEGKFENLSINVSDMVMEKFIALSNTNLPGDSGYTNIWQDTASSLADGILNLKGKIHLFLKTKSEDDMSSLYFTIHFRVKAGNETNVVSVFTKTVQFLFDWIKHYVEKSNITGENGKPFIVPPFPYSQTLFEKLF